MLLVQEVWSAGNLDATFPNRHNLNREGEEEASSRRSNGQEETSPGSSWGELELELVVTTVPV